MSRSEEQDFDNMYGCLYEDFKTYNQGNFIYYTFFIVRRVLFVWVTFFMADSHYSIFQIFFNVFLNLGFVLYLVTYKPFMDSF